MFIHDWPFSCVLGVLPSHLFLHLLSTSSHWLISMWWAPIGCLPLCLAPICCCSQVCFPHFLHKLSHLSSSLFSELQQKIFPKIISQWKNCLTKQHKNPFECRLSGFYITFCALGAALQWLILQWLHDKTVHELSTYYSKLVSDIDLFIFFHNFLMLICFFVFTRKEKRTWTQCIT